MPPKKKSTGKTIATLKHADATRKNLPTVEYQSLMREADKSPVQVAYQRRNRDLDPQFVWRGKDDQDWSDLVIPAPPLYIQEKVHPKVLIDDLVKQTTSHKSQATGFQIDLFSDFNGLPRDARATEFYQHDAHWSNRMILGDSLQVMASLAEREGLRGKVQCIYVDPPYGIKFNSNFQWSTTSRDVKDGNADHITREPEQVKAFRDTWRDGIHSYLTYLRDRLTVARDLLADSGSIFVQIGDENVHRIRGLMDEIFGEGNIVTTLVFSKTASQTSRYIPAVTDFVLWYAKDFEKLKYRPLFDIKGLGDDVAERYDRGLKLDGSVSVLENEVRSGLRPLPEGVKAYSLGDLTSQRQGRSTGPQSAMGFPVVFEGREYSPTATRGWSTTKGGIDRLVKAGRIEPLDRNLRYRRVLSDFPASPRSNVWTDVTGVQSRSDPKIYVVQTATPAVQRCLLMTTDPGDLVLDPTCGSGTTAYVAEQWGRRWITIDTSRVALALARARIMGARYPYYLLADSRDGQRKEAEITKTIPSEQPTRDNIRHGFVYERVPHITLKSIANNAEIDVIWEQSQKTLEPLREQLNQALGRTGSAPASGAVGDAPVADTGARAAHKSPASSARDVRREGAPNDSRGGCAPQKPWEEWEIPRELPPELRSSGRESAQTSSRKDQSRLTSAATEAEKIHAAWWQARIARQKAIDSSIAAKAEFEFLYDKPYDDKSKVRVAGPFTLESVSPHRMLTVNEQDEVVDGWKMSEKKSQAPFAGTPDFASVILENLKLAGVQQAHKEDRITFTSLTGWPGKYICAEGRYFEGSAPASGAVGDALVADTGARDERRAKVRREGAPNDSRGDCAPQRRAAIFIGPEFGTVSRPDLVAAAREAADANFDVLLACAFNYDAHSAEFEKLGRIPVLKARMNPDLHMAGELKNTGAGNLFVVFGEPDIEIESVSPSPLPSPPTGERVSEGRVRGQASEMIRVRVRGVDVFKPQTGEVVSAGPEGIACWFIDTDYNEESFFVRHAYFLGANDPYQALKTTLKSDIDAEAWATLHSAVSRPFEKPTTGRIAVKVINHLGDEVMKVFAVSPNPPKP